MKTVRIAVALCSLLLFVAAGMHVHAETDAPECPACAVHDQQLSLPNDAPTVLETTPTCTTHAVGEPESRALLTLGCSGSRAPPTID